MSITPTNRAHAALSSRSDAARVDRGREVLAEALKLQQATRGQAEPDFERSSHHRVLVVLVSVEAVAAAAVFLALAVILVRGGTL